MTQLVFRGWAQRRNEVVTVTADARGIRIDVLYDGVHALDVKPAISWSELDLLRGGASKSAELRTHQQARA